MGRGSPEGAASEGADSPGEAASPVTAAPAQDPAGPDPGRAARLERLRTRLAGRGAARREFDSGGRGARERRASQGASAAGPEPTCPRTAGPPERLERVETAVGPAWARVERFGPGATHGAWTLQEAFDADPDTWALLTGQPELAGVHAGDAVYLDTETTGLAGGVGTFVWMVGLGRFLADGGFEVWQGYLPGPEAEVPFLTAVAERIAAAGSIVSFFGRSYDQHRLLDRLRVHGLASPFEERPHLDLFAPLRRLVGDSLPNHKLQTLERALCAHERVDDLPGAAAPEAWFDSLAGRAHRMEGVFRHNLEDVLSLATLHGAGGRALAGQRASGEVLEGCPDRRRLGLGSAALERRDPARAATLVGEVPPGEAALAWRWLELRTRALARTGQVALARRTLALEGELFEPEDESSARGAVEAALLRARLELRAGAFEEARGALARARQRLAAAGPRTVGLTRRLDALEARVPGRV